MTQGPHEAMQLAERAMSCGVQSAQQNTSSKILLISVLFFWERGVHPAGGCRM